MASANRFGDLAWTALIVGANLGGAESGEGAATISLRRELCFAACPGSIDSLVAFAWRSKSCEMMLGHM